MSRYWLRSSRTVRWTEVPEELFIAAERAEGFSAPPGLVATAGFTGEWIDGTTLLDEAEAPPDLRKELRLARESLHRAVTELTHLKREKP